MHPNSGKESHWISGGMGHICPCPKALGFYIVLFSFNVVGMGDVSYSPNFSTVSLKTLAQSLCNIPADCLLRFTLQLTQGSVKCSNGSMVMQVSISSMFLLILDNMVVFRELLPRLRALTSLPVSSMFEIGSLHWCTTSICGLRFFQEWIDILNRHKYRYEYEDVH